MDFVSWLHGKKINAEAFRRVEPLLFSEWQTAFEQMHPNSFLQQKLFSINKIRHQFRLKETDKVAEVPSAKLTKPAIKPKKSEAQVPEDKPKLAEERKVVGKPVFRPKIKPKESTTDNLKADNGANTSPKKTQVKPRIKK